MSFLEGLDPLLARGLTIGLVVAVLLTIAPGLIWLERRLLALWQDRYGPNRVGPFGLLQSLADAIKLITKEDWIPPFADKAVFVIAPAIIVVSSIVSFAFIPLGPGLFVRWPAGLPTASSRCWAGCAPPAR